MSNLEASYKLILIELYKIAEFKNMYFKPIKLQFYFFNKILFQLRDNFNGWYTYIGSLKFHFPKLTNFNAIIAVIVLAKELTIK